MEISIVKESVEDREEVHHVILEAFKETEHSGGNEHILVDSLRKRKEFIPELSLVARNDEQIVGHILFSMISVQSTDGTQYPILSLAPVSVLPVMQGMGIGTRLIQNGHEIAQSLGYRACVLLGHESYYPRFGYQVFDFPDIKYPFDAPRKNIMYIQWVEGYLEKLRGTVIYPPEFYQ